MSKVINIGFLGCGNVGGGVWRLLNDFAGDIEHRTGLRFQVRKVLVRSLNKARPADLPQNILTTNVEDVLGDPDIDIVLEFLGGEKPACDYLLDALRRGKTVVTANKVAFALHWHELQAAAEQSGAGLYYEAAVCGAIPIIHTLEASLQANSINYIYGIVNGTTNYILTRMSREGAEYADVLADAQKLGLAEPDPSSDVEGLDAAYKLSILASLAFHGRVPFENVHIEGITDIKAEDIRCGQELGYTLKLLAIAKREGLKVETRVHPTFVRDNHPLANVNDAFNAVFLRGHACGEMMFMGRGAGDLPTASAIVSDLLRAAANEKHAYPTFDNTLHPAVAYENNTDWQTAFYVRMLAVDKPGVLSHVAQTFARYDVSIAAMQQKNAAPDGRVTLVFITHKASEQATRQALKALDANFARVESVLRVEG